MQGENLEEIFNQVKEKLLLDYKNSYLQQSYQQAFALLECCMYPLTYEKDELRTILEHYTYQQFSAQLKDWLVSGRYVWYVSGNISHDESVALVDNIRSLLSLKSVAVPEMNEVKMIKVEDGDSHGVWAPLKDATNENSCVASYYQIGQVGDDSQKKLTHQIVMNYLNEPFFDDLRTKQQLGYVVFSRQVNQRHVLGCQFLVQSPKKSCEYLVEAINNFLVAIREKVKAISDEEFEVQRQAVLTTISEKDYNLQKESGRFWMEISLHEYKFDRQQADIALLPQITKQQFIDCFEETFFSAKAKRIDLELTAKAHDVENGEYFEKNKEHSIFKDVFKARKIHKGSISEFKQGFELYSDAIKSNFAKM
mmetsp:Transcript_12503/g.21034  ORF Transcript_12503/g.21034 Transcript_12503/m.21034 type:complete len:366 (+) Transcript_12503:1830-2927(+)